MENKILVILFMLLFLVQNTNASDVYHTPRRIEATYSFEIIMDQKNPDEKLEYWLSLPQNSANQKNIKLIDISPKPDHIYQYKDGDCQIGYWELSSANRTNFANVTIKLKADLYKVDYFIDHDRVPDEYAKDHKIIALYLNNDSLAFVTAEILELANEITRNVKDPFLKARNIYRWVILHLEHQFPVAGRGTRYLFSNPIDSQRNLYGGDSAEYSWVFIALCRAVGVPARSVTGFLAKPGAELPHTWAEFHLPEWGWLPADPFLGDSRELLEEYSSQPDNYYYLGHLDNYHLAFYHGNGFELRPASSYSQKPFIFDNHVWYAPIGIWNFNHFANASANLMVTFDALLIKRYENSQYGIELNLAGLWLHQTETELGPYILKERFLTEDKLIRLDLIGRELPDNLKPINSKEAARLEIKALQNTNQSYQIISEQSLQIGKDSTHQFIAKLTIDNQQLNEYRVYVVHRGYLFWLIGSSSVDKFDDSLKKLKKMINGLKLNLQVRKR